MTWLPEQPNIILVTHGMEKGIFPRSLPMSERRKQLQSCSYWHYGSGHQDAESFYEECFGVSIRKKIAIYMSLVNIF